MRVSVALLMTLGAFIVGVAALVCSFFIPRFMFLGLGGAVFVLVLLPLTVSRHHLFSPWVVAIGLNVGFGVFLRGLAFALEWPSREILEDYFLRGRHPMDFVGGALLLLLGVSCIALGYWVIGAKGARPHDRLSPRPPLEYLWDGKLLLVGVSLLGVVGLVGFWTYFSTTGGLETAVLSAKRDRGLGFDLDVAEYRGRGYLLLLTRAAAVSYAMALIHALAKVRRLPFSWGMAAVAMGVVTIVTPVYASSRTDVLWPFIWTLLIFYYLRPKRVGYRTAPIVVGAGMFLFQILSLVRARPLEVLKGSEAVLDPLRWLEPAIINLNLMGIEKTAIITDAAPNALGYQYGRTLISWLLAPIPRSFWPGKPLVQTGPELGVAVFGTSGSGVPPGLIPELYWNFHVPGVVIGCVVVGWVLRTLYERWNPLQNGHVDPGRLLVYCVLVIPFSFGLITNGLTYAVLDSGTDMVMVMLAFVFLRRAKGSATGMSPMEIDADGVDLQSIQTATLDAKT